MRSRGCGGFLVLFDIIQSIIAPRIQETQLSLKKTLPKAVNIWVLHGMSYSFKISVFLLSFMSLNSQNISSEIHWPDDKNRITPMTEEQACCSLSISAYPLYCSQIFQTLKEGKKKYLHDMRRQAIANRGIGNLFL